MKLTKILPLIFTIGGAVGVLATGYFSAAAAKKSSNVICTPSGDMHPMCFSEYAKANWKHYIPAAISAGASIGLIFAGHCLTTRQKVALAASLSASGLALNEYRDKVREMLGTEKEAEIHKAVLESHILEGPEYMQLPAEADKTQLFYDSYSQRYFYSNEAKVIEAEYHFNRNFSFRGFANVNELYDFFDIPHTTEGEDWGWDWGDMAEGGLNPWIDFIHHQITTGDEPCTVIDYMWDPVYLPGLIFDSKVSNFAQLANA